MKYCPDCGHSMGNSVQTCTNELCTAKRMATALQALIDEVDERCSCECEVRSEVVKAAKEALESWKQG